MRRVTFSVLLGVSLLWPAKAVVAGEAVAPEHPAASEFSAAFGAATLSVFYFPVKLACGLGGALIGGAGGFLTGGDERVAQGVWRGMVEGDYFVRPEHVLGEKVFQPNGAQWGEEEELGAPAGSG